METPVSDPYDFHRGTVPNHQSLASMREVRADAGAPRPGALPALGRDHGAHDHKGERGKGMGRWWIYKYAYAYIYNIDIYIYIYEYAYYIYIYIY